MTVPNRNKLTRMEKMMMALRYGCVWRPVLGVDDMARGLPFADVEDDSVDAVERVGEVGEVGGESLTFTLVDARDRR